MIKAMAEPLILGFSESRNLSRSSSAIGASDDGDFARWLAEAERQPQNPIIIDLTGSAYADSARLSTMLKLRKTIHQSRKIGILAVDPLLARMLKRSHVDRVIPVYTTMEEARSALGT
jgi:anti-anti-sigma factor